MQIISQIFDSCGSEIVTVLITALGTILGYIGVKIKNIINNYVDEKTKIKVAETVVNALEQLKKAEDKYSEMSPEEIKEEAKKNIISILESKGITVTDLELEMLIQSTVNSFNKNKEMK